MVLRYEGTYYLKKIELTKEMKDGTSGDNFLVSKDIISQHIISICFWTIPIHLFQRQIGFLPRYHSC